MNAERDKPLTIAEIAERWDCSQETVRNLVKSGKLPGFREGRMMRVPLRYVLEMEAGGNPKAKPAQWRPPNDSEIWHLFVERANALEEAKRLRGLLEEMQSQRTLPKPTIDGVERDKYLEWARERVDSIDPLGEIKDPDAIKRQPRPWPKLVRDASHRR